MYTIIVPFNEKNLIKGETENLEEAKTMALNQGSACIVANYNSPLEEWIMDCYGGNCKYIGKKHYKDI